VTNADGVGTESGEQRGAGRSAKRLLAIGAVEDNTASGDGIDVWCSGEAVTVAAELGTEVIDSNEKDVARGRRGAGGGERSGKETAAEHG